jgi:hypothetical protein
MIRISKKIIENILMKNDRTMDIEYYPDKVYHPNCEDDWDRFENEKYEQSLLGCNQNWNKIKSVVLLLVKIIKIRKK